MARCAAREPAAALVVPKAERRTLGGGLREDMVVGQSLGVAEMCGWRVGVSEAVGRVRRAMAWMVGWEGRVERTERIWEP